MEQFTTLANVATVYLILRIVAAASSMLMQIATYFRLQGAMDDFRTMLKEKDSSVKPNRMGFDLGQEDKDGD